MSETFEALLARMQEERGRADGLERERDHAKFERNRSDAERVRLRAELDRAGTALREALKVLLTPEASWEYRARAARDILRDALASSGRAA